MNPLFDVGRAILVTLTPFAPASTDLVRPLKSLFALAAITLILTGCASSSPSNPPQPRPNTGYVDFYADPADQLSWNIERFDNHSHQFRTAFSSYTPLQDGTLRLPFAPGSHRLRISLHNRITEAPVEVDVQVEDGKITPVRITLTQVSTTLVDTKTISTGGTYYGRYGRRTRIRTAEQAVYSLSALAAPPISYTAKTNLPVAP